MDKENKWTYEKIMEILIGGLDQEKLKENDEEELSKFRQNLASFMIKLFEEEPKSKESAIRVIKAGIFSLIAQIPVVTPIITAMLQVITGDDLGTRMDEGFRTLSSKIDEGFKRMDEGFRTLGSKMDEGFRLIALLILAETPEEKRKIAEMIIKGKE